MAEMALSHLGTSISQAFPAPLLPYIARNDGPPPADYELTFRREPWVSIREDIMPFWKRHYAAIAKDKDRVPLDPDWDRYDAYDANSMLHVLVARDRTGAMVGYVFTLVGPHLHYRSTLCGFIDLYWLEPHARKGWNGVKLFRALEGGLKACGVRKIYGQCKTWHDVSVIFQRLSWTESERSFSKWIA